MVEIRPFAAADDGPVEALLRASWGHDPTLVRRTLVATEGRSRPRGARSSARGRSSRARSTPRMLMVAVNVAAGWRRRGAGSALFGALAGRSDGRPWLAKVTRRDAAGTAFRAR